MDDNDLLIPAFLSFGGRPTGYWLLLWDGLVMTRYMTSWRVQTARRGHELQSVSDGGAFCGQDTANMTSEPESFTKLEFVSVDRNAKLECNVVEKSSV